MSNIRTTPDLIDAALRRAGEKIDGTSNYEDRIIDYLNEAYFAVLSGGSEFGIDVDEVWSWAMAKRPIILTLDPAYEDGTISLTDGSRSGTFSSAPTESQVEKYIKVNSVDGYYRIVQHVAGETAFEIDSPYIGSTASGLAYKAIPLEYDLTDDVIIIDDFNNLLDFEDVDGTEITSTITKGAYSPSELATEIDTQMTADGGQAYTITWNSVTRRFTIASDGTFLRLAFGTGSNAELSIGSVLGFDMADYSTALTYTSEIPVNAIMRLVSPMLIHTERDAYYRNAAARGNINALEFRSFHENYPLISVQEGNPDIFTIVEEKSNGTMRVRFNAYPDDELRVEIPYIPLPAALSNQANSIPLLPVSHRSFLAYAAAWMLQTDKSDSRAQATLQAAQVKLQALVHHNRSMRGSDSRNKGRLIPRREQISYKRYNEIYRTLT